MLDSSRLKVINIGYAKKALALHNRERERMKMYARAISELHVIVFTDKNENFPKYQKEENLHLYATNSKTKVGKINDAIKIGNEIIAKDPDGSWLLSSQDPFETTIVGDVIANKNGVRHQIQVHGDVMSPGSSRESLLQVARVIYGRTKLRKAKCVRVVSQRIKKSLINNGLKEEVIKVLPIQADLDQFLAVGENRKYNANTGSCSFLYVGRLAKEKNLFLLIKSFAEVYSEFKGTSLTLMGDGEEQEDLENFIDSLGLKAVVKIIGWSDDVSEVMSKHDVFCLSSNHEGWGMVLLEAAAAGMPIVTTDVGCAGECIVSGLHGEVVNVKDESSYSAAMRKFLLNGDLIQRYGNAAFQLGLSQRLSKEAYVKKMVESWTSCL